MVLKILFTVAVITIVIILFRHKRGGAPVNAAAEDAATAIAPRALAYGLLAALVVVSLTVFALHIKSENEIIAIRVTSAATTTEYQARRKFIHGRSFTSVDGARITLGANERMEISE